MKKIRKDIKKFLTSEEGKMLDSDVVKAGLTLGILGAGLVDDLNAQSTVHTNYFANRNVHGWSGHYSHVSHGSHSSHGSHGSHSSHGSHGSHGSHSSHGSHGSHSSHGSHASHGSHGSHGSHSRGGWC